MEQSSNKDVLHWSDLAQRGQVYEAIMDWLRLGNLPPYHITTPTTTYYMDPSKWDREQVKKQFMVAMFGDDTSLPVWKAIEANWPTVAAIAAKVKNRRYQALAHACQRLESSIVIQAACGSLCSRLPAIPLATVHDCLILPTDFVGAAQEALHHAFKMHGVVPSISVESLAA